VAHQDVPPHDFALAPGAPAASVPAALPAETPDAAPPEAPAAPAGSRTGFYSGLAQDFDDAAAGAGSGQ
jgi:hypothetical protein